MPTFSTTGLTTFSNIGPLTTVYTPPSTCTQIPSTGLGLAYSQTLVDHAVGAAFSDYCPKGSSSSVYTFTDSHCLPSGKKYVKALNAQNTKPPYNYIRPYYSPGRVCPSDWSTVGHATKDVHGSLTTAGVFTDPFKGIPKNESLPPTFDPLINEFLHALDKNETAIACCQSGYTGYAYGGACYSTMPFESYTKSEACYTYIPDQNSLSYPVTTTDIWWYGSTTRAELIGDTPVHSISASTVSLTVKIGATPTYQDDSATGPALNDFNYVAIVYQDMITMVHGVHDAEATAEGSDDDESAAMRVGGQGVGLMATLGAWGLAAVVGACMMI